MRKDFVMSHLSQSAEFVQNDGLVAPFSTFVRGPLGLRGKQVPAALSKSSDGSSTSMIQFDVELGILPVPTAWTQSQKLTASDAAANDYMGGGNMSIAMNDAGTLAAIGAYGDDSSAGAVYIFELVGSTWSEVVKLVADDRASGDFFGTEVSMSGDGTRVVVGAYLDHHSSLSDVGSVYTFENVNGTWIQTDHIMPADPESTHRFGYGAQMSGDGGTLVVGAYDDDDGGVSSSGALYFYTRNPDRTWTYVDEVWHGDPESFDILGLSVAISENGERVIAGAHQKSWSGTKEGAAYVFEWDGEIWVQAAKLEAPDATFQGRFGASTAMSRDGEMLVVGAYSQDTSGGIESGKIYVFERVEGTWTFTHGIIPDDGAGSDNFGLKPRIAADNTRIVATSIQDDDDGSASGSAYIFGFADSAWTQLQKLTASDAAAGDQFGRAAAMSENGRVVIIGSQHDDDDGTSSGSAYVFNGE